MDGNIPEEVFEEVQRRARMRGSIKNKLFYPSPQDKLLNYLASLELIIEKLENEKSIKS